MQGTENHEIVKGFSDPPRGAVYASQRGAEVFPPVGGQQQEALVRPEICRHRDGISMIDRISQGVDNGVPGDKNAIPGDAFPQQMLPAQRSRGKEQIAQPICQLSVHFLRKRAVFVVAAQARLHMPDRDLMIVGCKRGGQAAACVPVHQYKVRANNPDNLLHPSQHGICDRGQALSLPHDVQVIVRRQTEDLQHLVEHLPVLAGHTNRTSNVRTFLQFFDQRRHFDGLRPGAEYAEHTNHVYLPFRFSAREKASSMQSSIEQ